MAPVSAMTAAAGQLDQPSEDDGPTLKLSSRWLRLGCPFRVQTRPFLSARDHAGNDRPARAFLGRGLSLASVPKDLREAVLIAPGTVVVSVDSHSRPALAVEVE